MPISHRELLEKLSGLEVKIESPKKPDEEKQEEDSGEELNFNGIDFGSELRRVLSFQPQHGGEEVIAGSELEGAAFAAPRISIPASRSPELHELDYSKNAYDVDLYKKKPSDYESNTPNYAAKSSGESSAGAGNGSPGQNFQTRAGRSSESGNSGQ